MNYFSEIFLKEKSDALTSLDFLDDYTNNSNNLATLKNEKNENNDEFSSNIIIISEIFDDEEEDLI